MKELGINCADTPRRMVPYCCRHTYASLADRAGVDKDTIIKTVSYTHLVRTAAPTSTMSPA